MRKAPTLYTMRGLYAAAYDTPTLSGSQDGKHWYPARPSGFFSLRNRLRCAWAVFTGRADAFTWPGGQ